MRLPFPESRYCIDTCALIDLRRRWYPRDVFQSLWTRLEDLVTRGYLVSPREVRRELRRKDDEVLEWANGRKYMFKDPDYQQIEMVLGISDHFPDFVDWDSDVPDADPFVVALAKCEDCTVVTSETRARSGMRPKIPNVCDYYNITCLSLIQFFKEQKWIF